MTRRQPLARPSSPIRSCLLALTVASTLASPLGCSQADPEGSSDDSDLSAGRGDAPTHLIVIVVDTLRADHLGYHGYGRDTSPFLDSLADESVVFERAYAASAFTRESIAALLTGRLPSLSGSLGWYAAPSAALPTLGESYRDAGYRTGFFTTTIMLGNERFTRGFQDVEHLVAAGGVSGMSHALTERALSFAANAGDEPFMMYVHYFDPHAPYEPPQELQLEFTDEIYPDPVGLYTQLRPAVPEYVARGFGPGDPQFEDQQVRYDAEIRDTDNALRALFAGLEELGVADDTLVVITSDHGEEFLDHGFVEHAWTLYEESVHVPLLVWNPQRRAARRVARPVSLVDIVPTVTTFQGVARDGKPTDGHVLLDEQGAASPPSVPVVSELLIQHRNVLRSAVVGEWKYIQARRWLTPQQRSLVAQSERKHELRAQETEFDTWSPVVHEELYNLATDPGESENLVASEPQRLTTMREALRLFEQRARSTAAGQQGAADEQPMDQDQLDAIKAIGY